MEATKHLSALNDSALTCEGDIPSLSVAVAMLHIAATVDSFNFFFKQGKDVRVTEMGPNFFATLIKKQICIHTSAGSQTKPSSGADK